MSVVHRRQAPRTASEAKRTIPRSTAGARIACLAIALAPVAVVAAAPADADGAPYAVWACANGSGAPLGVGSWVRNGGAGVTSVQTTCGEPSVPVGALFARARAVSAQAPGGGGWVVAAAKGTRITGLYLWWSWQAASGGAIRVYALGSAFLDPTGAIDPFDGKGLCCTDSAFVNLKPGAFGAPTTSNPGVAFAQLNHQSFPKLRGLDGRGVPIAGLAAVCVTGCDSGEPVAQYQAYRIKTIVEDAGPPSGKATGLDDGLRVGPGTTIDATASDTGGGVREVSLRVDGTVVQRAPSGAGCADVDPSNSDPLEYNLMKPCPSTLSGQLTLSAAQMPDNQPHQMTVVATDAAGQDTVLRSARVALAAPGGFYDATNGFYNPDLNVAGPRKVQRSASRCEREADAGLRPRAPHRPQPDGAVLDGPADTRPRQGPRQEAGRRRTRMAGVPAAGRPVATLTQALDHVAQRCGVGAAAGPHAQPRRASRLLPLHRPPGCPSLAEP